MNMARSLNRPKGRVYGTERYSINRTVSGGREPAKHILFVDLSDEPFRGSATATLFELHKPLNLLFLDQFDPDAGDDRFAIRPKVSSRFYRPYPGNSM